jgi:hypothetical protein
MPRSLRPFLIALTLLIGGLFLSSSSALAAPQINNQINYQARLMDSSGFPVADGNYSIIFSLYDASTAGNRLWTAAGTLGAPTAITVNVQNGLFTVLLGDTGQNTLDTVNWNSDQLYLGVTINADAEMSPRKRFASAPSAFNARQLQGMYASSTASGGQTLFTLNQTQNDAATGTRSALDVRSNGTSNSNDFLVRGINDTNTVVFSVNRQGSVTSTNVFVSGLTSSTNLNANIASFATATIAGQGICLSNGQFCSTGSTPEADTLQTVSNRGSFTTTTLTLFGGLTVSNISATGTLNVTGASTLNGLTFTNATGTNVTSTNVFATNGTITSLSVGTLGVTGLTWTNATGTNTTSTNLFATNLGFSNATGVSLNANQSTIAIGNINTLFTATGTVTSLNFVNATGATLGLLSLVSNTVTSTSIAANIGTFATATVMGSAVCLASGVGCPAGTVLSDTLQSVTARGSFTTTTVQFFGGLTASNITATGSTSLQNTTATNLASTGLLSFTTATGSTLNANFAQFASATVAGQGICLQNGVGCPSVASEADTLASVTNRGAFATSSVTLFGGLTASNISATGTLSVTGNSSLSGLTFTNATGVNATTTGRLSFNIATGTSLLTNALTFGSGIGGTLNITTALTVNGINVCLQDNTNCPVSGGSSNDGNWVFNSSTQQLYQVTTTLDVLIGGSSEPSSPFVFLNNATDSRLVVGGGTAIADVVIGAATSSGLNTAFQLTGDDLFVQGNIGSVSSVYTNGAFVAGSGSTYYGNGYINKNDGNLIIDASGGFITPTVDLAVSLGSGTNRYNGVFGNVTSTHSTSSNFYATNGTITTLNVSALGVTGLTWINATGTNTTSTNLFATNLLFGGSTGTSQFVGSLGFTTASGTSLVSNQGSIGSATIGTLFAATGTITSLNFINATGATLGLLSLVANSVTSTSITANIGTFATATVMGSAVCLASGVGCPAGTVLSDTLQSVSARGSFTTTSLQFFGGFVAASSSVTGTLNVSGSLSVTGTSNLQTLTFTNATGSTLNAATVTTTNLSFTGATGTTLTISRGSLGNSTATNLFVNTTLGFLNGTGTTLNTNILSAATGTISNLNFFNSTGTFLFATTGTFRTVTSTFLFANSASFATATVMGSAICLSSGVGCPSTSSNDTLLTVSNRGAIATSTLTLYGGFVAASSSVTGTLNVAGTSNLLGDVYVGTSTYSVTLNSDFVIDGNDLYAEDNIGSVSSIFSNGMFVAGETGPTLFGDGFINQTDGALVISADSPFLFQPSISIIAGDVPSGLAGDVNIRAGDGLGGNPAGNIYLTPGNSLGQPGHMYLQPVSGSSNTPQFRFTSLGGGYIGLESPSTSNSVNFVLPFADGASSTVIGTDGFGRLTFTSVCLSDGTNCSVSTGADLNWTFNLAGDFVRNATATTDVIIGSSTVAGAPFVFLNNTTTSRFIVGRASTTGAGADLVIGATTATGMNTLFQLTGDDLFVQGNIGSASSVYTNGAFIAGSGSTYFGNGYINKNDGDLAVSSTGALAFQGRQQIITATGTQFLNAMDMSVHATSRFATSASMGLVNSGNRLSDAQNDTLVTANFTSNNFNIISMNDRTSPRNMSTTTLSGAWLPKLDQDYLYIFNWSSGILFSYGIADQTLPSQLSSLTGFSAPYGSYLAGQYLYVSDNTGLKIVDVSDPRRLRLASSVAFGSGAKYGIAVRGGYAYVTDSATGALYTIDVRNPLQPVLANTTPSFTGPREIVISDKDLYVVDVSASSLSIVDIRNATSPAVIATAVTGIASPNSVVVNGRYAYVGNNTNIAVYDVASSTSPEFIKTFGTFSGSNHELMLVGRTLISTGATQAHFYDIGGVETNGLTAGSAWIGQATVGQSLTVSQDANIYGALRVGEGGISTIGKLSGFSLDVANVRLSLATSSHYSSFPTGIAVRSNIAYLADSSLYIVDVTNPSTPSLISSLSGLNGSDLTLAGDYLYASANSGLRIIDVSNPSAPTSVGFFANGLNSSKPAISGNYAFMGGFDFQVVDISNPVSPTSVATVVLTGSVTPPDIQGKYAYFGSNSATFNVYDVSDPRNPRSVGSLGGFSSIYKVKVMGRYAYVLDNLSVRVVDISNPASPSLVSTVTTDATLQLNDLEIDGRYLYVSKHTEGIDVYDVSVPSTPVKISGYDTPGAAFGISSVGKYLYVADFGNGLTILDKGGADISSAKIGSIEIGAGQVLNNLDIGGQLNVHGGILAGIEGILSRGAVNAPSILLTPTVFSTSTQISLLGTGSSLAVSGEVAAVSQGLITPEIRLYDVSDPKAPSNLGSRLTDTFNKMLIKGDYLYELGGTISAYDISAPTQITRVASTTSLAPYAGFIGGSYLYVTTDIALNIYDISDPTKITTINSIALTNLGLVGLNARHGLYVRGGYAYITDIGTDRLMVVDVHDPLNATMTGFVPIASNPRELAVGQNYAYVANNGGNAIEVVNITSSTNPRILRSMTSVQAAPREIELTGNYLYVGGSTGVAVYDVTSSTQPLLIKNILVGAINDIKVQGNVLHVTTPSNYYTYDIQGLVAPAMSVGSAQIGTGYIENDLTVGNQLFVGGGLQVNGSISAHDLISAPSITISGFGSVSTVQSFGTTVSADVVKAVGDYVYALEVSPGRVRRIHVGDAGYATQTAVGAFSSGALGMELDVVGQRIYIAATGIGLLTFDSDPATGTLRQVSTTTLPGGASAVGIRINGGIAYVASNGGLFLYSLADPDAPSLIGEFDDAGTYNSGDVDVYDRYAYVPECTDGLKIVDVSNSAAPRKVATVSTPLCANTVTVSNGYAYVGQSSSPSILIIDVKDPSHPVQVASITDISNYTESIERHGNYLYVADNGAGIKVYDVSSSTRPVSVYNEVTGGAFTADYLSVAGSRAFVATNGGMRIYELPSLAAPTAKIGTLSLGRLFVDDDGYIEGRLNIGDSLEVGSGGLLSQGPVFVSASSASSVVSIINSSSGTTAWGAYIDTLLLGNDSRLIGADDHTLFVSASSDNAVVRIRNTHTSATSPYTAWGLWTDSIAVSGLTVAPAVRDSWTMYLDYSSATNRGGLCIDDVNSGGGCPVSSIGGRSIMTDAGISANAFDLAERYSVSGTAEGGDLLVFESSTATTVTKHTGIVYDAKLVGISSLNPGFELGWSNPTSTDVAVALAGRVPTKISMNNGAVEIGDPLTSSDVPGYAMKATKPGMIVGYALEDVSATGTHEVFVSVGYWAGNVLATDGTISTINDAVTITASASATDMNPTADSWGLTFRGEAWDASSTSAVASSFTLLTDIMSATTSRFTIRSTSGTDLFAIDQEGNATIAGDLSVSGKLFPSSKGGGMQSDWYVFVDDTSSTAAYISTNANGWQSMDTYDFAERYYSPDELEPGDLVVVSDTGRTHVQRSMNETAMVLGIVSTRPAFIAGRPATSTYPIALSGRVPTKVSGMNGAIKAGDPLAPTSIPGVAAKAIHTGPIVGLALEDYDQTNVGSIEVFVNPGWWTNQAETNQETIINNTVINNVTEGVTRRGVGMIAAGSKRVHISFDSIGAYPFVQVTPRGLIQGNWGTDGYSDTGFDILLSAEQTFDAYFSWQVEPLQGSDRLNLSDGTSADIDPVTGLPFGFTTPTTTEPIIEETLMTTSTEALPESETTSTDSVIEPTESETSSTSTEEIAAE